MSTEEPAWKAELREHASQRLGCYTQDEVLMVILPHIQAAEERGRREALTEAAGKIRTTYPNVFSRENAVADLIDPESP